jgi:hypothetical protein
MGTAAFKIYELTPDSCPFQKITISVKRKLNIFLMLKMFEKLPLPPPPAFVTVES